MKYILSILLTILIFTLSCSKNENKVNVKIQNFEFGISLPWANMKEGGFHGLDLSYPPNYNSSKLMKKFFMYSFHNISKTKIKWVRHFLFGSGEYYFGIQNRSLNNTFFKNLKYVLKLANKNKLNLIFVLWNHKIFYKKFRGKKNRYFNKNFFNQKFINKYLNIELPRLMRFIKKHNNFNKSKIAFEIFNEPEFLFFEFIWYASDRHLIPMLKMGSFLEKQSEIILKIKNSEKIPILTTIGLVNPLKPWLNDNFLVKTAYKKWICFLRDKVKPDFYQLHIYGPKNYVSNFGDENDTVDIFAKTNSKYIFEKSIFYNEIIKKEKKVYIGEYPININSMGYTIDELVHHSKKLNISGIFFWSYAERNTKHGLDYGDFSKLDKKLFK